MPNYFVLLILLLCFLGSCDQDSSVINQSLKTNSLTYSELDSIIQEIEKDSSTSQKNKKYHSLRNKVLRDTLSLSKLNFQLAKLEPQKINLLDSVLMFESYLSLHAEGKGILAKTFDMRRKINFANGDIEHVVTDCEKYLFYARNSVDTLTRCKVLNALGTSYEKLGDSKKAIATLELFYTLAEQYSNPKLYIDAVSDLANSYGQHDELTKARELIKKGLNYSNLRPFDREWLLMMQANFEPDQDKQILLLKTLFAKVSSDFVKQNCAKTLKNIYLDRKDYKSALEFTFQTISDQQQEPRELAKSYLSIGDIYKEENMKDSAMHYYDKGLGLLTTLQVLNSVQVPIDSKLKAENTIYDLLMAKVDLLSKNKNVNPSNSEPLIHCLNSAMHVCELLRAEMIFDESKYDMAYDLKLVASKLIKLYFDLYTQTKKQEYAIEAFMIAEHSKAVALQDHIEQDILMNEKSDSNYATYISIRKELNEVEIELSNATESRLQDSLEKSKLELSASLGIYKSITNALNTSTEKEFAYKELTLYLKEHNLSTLSYFIGDDQLYIFYHNPITNQLLFNHSDTSVLNNIIKFCTLQFDRNFFNSNQKLFLQQSNLIYKTLVASVLPSNNQTTSLIILPDGPLHNLAFDALITNEKEPSSFLLKKVKIGYAYSIRSLILQHQRTWNEDDYAVSFAPFCSGPLRGLPQLAGSKNEVQHIEESFHFKSYQDKEADFNTFENQIKQTSFLHISSHASSTNTPQLEFFDSSIQVNSLYHISMNPQLAFLNTCQSGAGATVFSEGNLSLGRAFYSNGAHNVILSYWNMDDYSSALLSDLFYKKLKKSNNAIDALHEAKLDYLSQQSIDKQAPYYWASLQEIGDGEIKLQSSYSFVLKWLTGLSLVVLILFQRKRFAGFLKSKMISGN